MTLQAKREAEVIGKLLQAWRLVGDAAELAEPGVFGATWPRRSWRQRARCLRGLVLILAARVTEFRPIERGEKIDWYLPLQDEVHRRWRRNMRAWNRKHRGPRQKLSLFPRGFPWRWAQFHKFRPWVAQLERRAMVGFGLNKPEHALSTRRESVNHRRWWIRKRAGLVVARSEREVSTAVLMRDRLEGHMERLVAAMHDVEPGAWRGAPVGVRELRAAMGLSKSEFDGLVLRAAASGRVSLMRHDCPSSLSAAERADLVSDGESFFVVVALRPAD